MLETDKVFAGSIPEKYDRYMVPLIFEPFASDLAQTSSIVVAKGRSRDRRWHWGCPPRIGTKTVPERKLYRNRPQPADARLRPFATSSRQSH
jgi:hypothetical protein